MIQVKKELEGLMDRKENLVNEVHRDQMDQEVKKAYKGTLD